MSIEQYLVIISIFIAIAGSMVYINDTLAGKTQPNRVTWFMWALGPLIGALAAFSAGADMWANSRIFLAGVLPLATFAASFANDKSYWKLTSFDIGCGVLSGVALVLWLFYQSPELAIIFAILADAFAGVPTFWKAWIAPETETGFMYFATFLSVLLVLPVIPEWNIENAAFQIFLIAEMLLMMGLIYRKRLFRSSSRTISYDE